MHAFMILILLISKKKKKMKLYVQSQCIIDFVHGELFSCDLTDSEIVPSRESDIQNFAD